MLKNCTLCPQRCQVDRTASQTGVCQIDATVKVASVMAHFGEESALVGRGGSGTIFFTGCNLDCVFCQNYDISHSSHGQPCSTDKLANLALALQDEGWCAGQNRREVVDESSIR